MLDNNISFNENFVIEEKIKGKRSLVIQGYLDDNGLVTLNWTKKTRT